MSKAAELAALISSQSALSDRNIIINGAMQVAQRSTSQTGLGASDGYFTLDRFKVDHGATSAGRYTMSQSAVTDLAGFPNALKIDCTTADTSIAAGEALILNQKIEGLACQSLKASSTSTNAFTLSFYAKSNASRAIASEILLTEGTNRQISKLHTINTSWARYTMTVPAASSTEIDNDNTDAMQVQFWLHGGSTYTGGTLNTASLASLTNANRAAGIGSIFASTDNTIEITGVQLELGEQATPFEHRSFGDELARCQRYYSDSGATNNNGFVHSCHTSTAAYGNFSFPVPMRTTPTITMKSSGRTFFSNGASRTITSFTAQNVGTQNFQHFLQCSGVTAGHAGHVDVDADTRFYKADAEL